MINRLIYNGQVYYKVAELAQLFGVSVYKMRKIVNLEGIGTKLEGWGNTKFVLEENVAKIEVRNEVKILETKFTADPVKKTKTVKEPVIPVEKTTKRTKKAKKEKKLADVEEMAVKKVDEKLQKEFEELLEKGRDLGHRLYMANKMDIANTISDEHFGIGGNFLNATIDDIDKLRLIVPKLENAVAELNEVSDEIAAASDDSSNDETELSF